MIAPVPFVCLCRFRLGTELVYFKKGLFNNNYLGCWACQEFVQHLQALPDWAEKGQQGYPYNRLGTRSAQEVFKMKYRNSTDSRGGPLLDYCQALCNVADLRPERFCILNKIITCSERSTQNLMLRFVPDWENATNNDLPSHYMFFNCARKKGER